MKMKIEQRIAQELKISLQQVEKTVALLDEGNTVPFIARYRKEVTGNLTDETIRDLEERLKYYRNLEEQREMVLRRIDEQGKLTDALKESIEKAETLKELEDIYLPYRPKRRTRATIAREKGLYPLAEILFQGVESVEEAAPKFVTEEVKTPEEAIQGAMDILAEQVAEMGVFRDIVRRNAWKEGVLRTEKNSEEDQAATYAMYFDREEKISELPSHRILAINRGEKEGHLKVKLLLADDRNTFRIYRTLEKVAGPKNRKYLELIVEDSYKRLLRPSIETEVRQELTDKAGTRAIKVFAQNLRPYLMQPPIFGVRVIGLDPGFRTGCKMAVISELGEVLDYGVIYPTTSESRRKESKKILKDKIEKYGATLLAIGNGTASRETEQVVAELIQEMGRDDIHYAIVNESGASIYSASKLAQEEFPDLDVTIRGAISIARRIQDPLAELVKIEPKHIGIGQYQHDVNQKELEETLGNVVEDCVNAVGVDLNTASPALLRYISGLSKNVAENIVEYKREHGAFKNREQLKDVKGLGPKTFQQAAGFLRIPDGDNPLDNTAVHPESYAIAEKIKDDFDEIDIAQKAEELGVGEPTLRDIVEELKKPGRDPRDEMPKPILRSDVLNMDDLKVGMVLMGTVRNVVDFGCFIDIGVKQDGLLHRSKMKGKPEDNYSVSDTLEVEIASIDKERERIELKLPKKAKRRETR